MIETGLELLRDPSFKAIEMVHQILKQIVTMAVADPKCTDLVRFFNLKAEMLQNASNTLGGQGASAWVECQAVGSHGKRGLEVADPKCTDLVHFFNLKWI